MLCYILNSFRFITPVEDGPLSSKDKLSVLFVKMCSVHAHSSKRSARTLPRRHYCHQHLKFYSLTPHCLLQIISAAELEEKDSVKAMHIRSTVFPDWELTMFLLFQLSPNAYSNSGCHPYSGITDCFYNKQSASHFVSCYVEATAHVRMKKKRERICEEFWRGLETLSYCSS